MENKLKQLENGLYKHNAEVGEIKKQINTMKMSNTNLNHIDDGNGNNNNKEQETQIVNNVNRLNENDMEKDSIIKFDADNEFDQKHCSLRTDVIPRPDVQVCVTVIDFVNTFYVKFWFIYSDA